MTYWLDLFTPRTWEEARERGFTTSGFRESRWSIVSKIKEGDYLVCYLTQLSRFCGVLKVVSEPYKDEQKAKGIWKEDLFPCLVDTKPVIAVDFLHSIPKGRIFPRLSSPMRWSGIIRGSPVRLPEEDGAKILGFLQESQRTNTEYPLEKIGKITGKEPRKSKKQFYGQPINFRGLRHAPINEQGVVYLFALVSKDLGFTVEAIGTSFPDCEAMRSAGKNRGSEHWERVRIEFEFRSSDFKAHRHHPQGCDVIVCWIHDWKNCPIEVIELRKVIESLGSYMGGIRAKTFESSKRSYPLQVLD